MKSKRILVPITIAVVMLLTTICFKAMDLRRELVVGTAPTLPPFTYVGGAYNGEIIGFDIELAKAIAKDRGEKLKLKIMYFDELLPAVANGEIDMAISVLTVTEDRKKIVDFSDSYLEDESVLLIREDDTRFAHIHTKEALGANKRIGSQTNTITAYLAKAIAGNNYVSQPQTWDEVIIQLLDYEIDSVIIGSVTAKNYMEKYDNLEIHNTLTFDKEEYAVAVKKGNAKLLKDINKTLKKLENSGEYDKLLHEYIK